MGSPPTGIMAWSRVVLWHLPAPLAEHGTDLVDQLLTGFEFHTHHIGNDVAGDVVLSRTEAATQDHGITS